MRSSVLLQIIMSITLNIPVIIAAESHVIILSGVTPSRALPVNTVVMFVIARLFQHALFAGCKRKLTEYSSSW